MLFRRAAGSRAAAFLTAMLGPGPLPELLTLWLQGAALALSVGRFFFFFLSGTCFGQSGHQETFQFFPVSVYVDSIRSCVHHIHV
jgi:hypothetical protein